MAERRGSQQEKKQTRENGVFLDIGGGTIPDYFIREAAKNPRGEYVVVDPTIRPIINKPDNLHLIKWGASYGVELPFKDQTFDQISMNFMLSELRLNHTLDWSDPILLMDNAVGAFPYDEAVPSLKGMDWFRIAYPLFQSARRVLKPEGSIVVVESLKNFYSFMDFLDTIEYGVKSIDESYRAKSNWIKCFYDLSQSDHTMATQLPIEINVNPFQYKTIS